MIEHGYDYPTYPKNTNSTNEVTMITPMTHDRAIFKIFLDHSIHALEQASLYANSVLTEDDEETLTTMINELHRMYATAQEEPSK